MSFDQIQCKFRDSVLYVASHIGSFSVCPHKDFARRRKLPADMLISFLVSQGASSTGNELIDFFDFSPSALSLFSPSRGISLSRRLWKPFSICSTNPHSQTAPLKDTGSLPSMVPPFPFSANPLRRLTIILFAKAIP